jgi:hypothetical protein
MVGEIAVSPDRNLCGTRFRSSPKTAAIPWPTWFNQNGRPFGGRFVGPPKLTDRVSEVSLPHAKPERPSLETAVLLGPARTNAKVDRYQVRPLCQNNPAERLRKSSRLLLTLKIDA